MRVLFAGTPGVRKSKALENLRSAIRRLFPEDRIFSVDNRVPIIDQSLYGGTPLPFLQQPEPEQKALWQRAFKSMVSSFDHARNDHHFLGAHLTYRYEQIPHCVVSFADVIAWKPDMIVTFVDDAYLVRERIHRGGYTSFTLAELILWRAEEILVGDLLALSVNPQSPPPNFVVAVTHPAEMLARLVMHKPRVPRIYLSHEITGSATRNRSHDGFREVIDDIRTKLRRRNLVVFEPLTIDELPPILSSGGRRGKQYLYDPAVPAHRWPILDAKSALASDEDLRRLYPLRIPKIELQSVKNGITAQVAWRDIRLVEQSHCLLVYRPTLSGDRSLSTGVNTEVRHARNTGRRVIFFIKKGDPIPSSPFVAGAPGGDPDFIVASDERLLWERLETIKADVERDYFLRPRV